MRLYLIERMGNFGRDMPYGFVVAALSPDAAKAICMQNDRDYDPGEWGEPREIGVADRSIIEEQVILENFREG